MLGSAGSRAHLVDGRPVGVVHLVKLINQADTLIGQHQSTTFKRPLSRYRVFSYTGSETDSRGTLTGGKDSSVRGFLDILEELRLGCTGVTEHEDVDVATNAMLAVDILGNTAKEGESEGKTDVLVAVDGGSDRLDDALADALVSGQGANLPLVFFSETEGGKLVFLLVDVVGLEHSREDGEAVLDVE